MCNNRFLKTLLTTVSTLALVTGAAEPTMANPTVRSPTSSALGMGGSAWTPGGVFNNLDSVLLTSSFSSYAITIQNPSVTNIAAIDAGGLALSGSTITSNNQFGTGISIGSIGNAASGTIGLFLYDGVSFSLIGTASVDGAVVANNYSALGPVRLGSSTDGSNNPANTPSVLNITATGAVTFTNTFDSFNAATANWGTLNISGANHIFNGIIGGIEKLGAINITDGSNITFGNNVTATSINLQNSASQITFSGGTINSSIFNNSTSAGSRIVNINGGDVTLAGSIGTSTNPLNQLHFSTDNTITISGTQDIYSFITPYADGKGTLKLSGGTTTLHYNVGSYTGSNPPTRTASLKSININDQTLVIDSTVGNFYVGGSITTTTTGNGTLTTQGANSVTLYNDIGNGNGNGTGPALGNMNINTNTTLYSK